MTNYYREKGLAKYENAPKIENVLSEKRLDQIKVLYDNRGILAKAYKADDVLPRLFVINKNQVVVLDEKSICSSCIQNDLSDLLDGLLE